MPGYASGGGNLLAISDQITAAHDDAGLLNYTDIAFEFSQLGEVQVTRDTATGYYGFTIDSVQLSAALTTILETWAPALTSGEVEEYTYTDGVKIGGTTGAAPDLLGINYGAIHTDSNKRLVTTAVVKTQLDAGAYTETSGNMVRHNITWIGQKAKQAIVIPAAMFCTALVSGATATTIAANSGGKQVWFTPAS